MARFLALCFLALSPFFACAKYVATPPSVSAGTAGGTVSYGGGFPANFTRQITASPGSAAQIIDNIRLGLPGGAIAEASAMRIVTKAALTTAMGIALGVGGAVAIQVALPFLESKMKDAGMTRDSSGRAVVDMGTDKTTSGGLMQDFRTGEYMTPGAIQARELAMAYNTCNGDPSPGYCAPWNVGSSCSNGKCRWAATVVRKSEGGTNQYWIGGQDERDEVTAMICPQNSLAPLTVVYDKPCPTGVPSFARPEDMPKVVDKIPEEDMPGIVDEMAPKVDIPTSKPQPDLSGPGVVESPPQRTTKPDGTVSTEVKRHEITYEGDKYSYTTTIVTNNDGDVTTIENPAPVEEGKTDCDKYPDAVGCIKAGDAPPEKEIKKREITVDASPGGGWGADDGSCPEPPTVEVLGQAITIDNTLVCQFMGGIRFAVIAAFALMAAMLVAGGIQT